MKKLKMLIPLSALLIAACSSSSTQPMALNLPSSDLLIPPESPLPLCCDLKRLPIHADHNGKLLNSSNDKLIRWQEWWSGSNRARANKDIRRQ